jgi:broad specificity phosphatase PhoE
MTSEKLPSQEAISSNPSFDVVLARHAQYVDPRTELAMRSEGVPEEEIKAQVGHLTEDGIAQAHAFGLDILRQAVDEGEDVDITFIPSSQPYDSPAFPDAPWSGKRAEETATQSITAMVNALHELETDGKIEPGKIRLATPRPDKTFEAAEMPNNRLVERDVYNPHNALGKSLISLYRLRTEQVLEDEAQTGMPITSGYEVPSDRSVSVDFTNPDKREKELWSRGVEDLDSLAVQADAETSKDVAGRVMSVVEDMNELARLHEERNPGRKLLVVLVSHDAVTGAVTSQGMGAEQPVIPNYMDRVNIHVQDATAHFEQNGIVYERPLSSKE